MTPEQARKLVREALESRTLGQALIALMAVEELELCPPGTLARLEVLDATSPVAPGENFEGTFVESRYDGFCSDCGEPYAEGEQIYWRGPGRGALCRGCRVAETSPSVKRRR